MTDMSNGKRWVPAALVAAVAYFVVGYGSAAFDPSVPERARFAWRLGAWTVSAVVFALHIGYERFRLYNSARALALHTAAAVALGGFLIAIAAAVHATTVAEHSPYSQYLLALVLWPIITGVPAFFVALVVGAVLSHLPRLTRVKG